MDFAPEQTTVPGRVARAGRSALTSSSLPRCTPPMPPVAKTWTPALRARNSVAETVVPPSPRVLPRIGRSRRLHFRTSEAFASRSISSSPSPSLASPRTTPATRGSAPPARTAAIISRITSRFTGRGSPWVITVLSNATGGGVTMLRSLLFWF